MLNASCEFGANCFTMPKQNSIKRKKRSFHGNRYVKIHNNERGTVIVEDRRGEVGDGEEEELDFNMPWAWPSH